MMRNHGVLWRCVFALHNMGTWRSRCVLNNHLLQVGIAPGKRGREGEEEERRVARTQYHSTVEWITFLFDWFRRDKRGKTTVRTPLQITGTTCVLQVGIENQKEGEGGRAKLGRKLFGEREREREWSPWP